MRNIVSLSIHELDAGGLSVEEVAAMPSDVLHRLQEQIEIEKDLLRKRIAYFEHVLDIRYRDRAEQARKDVGKDTGTVRLADNDYVVVAEAPKQVHWDRDKLADILDTFDPDTAKHFGKWTLTVEERKFSAATPEIQDALQPARTVSIGKTKYRLEPIMEPLEKTDAV